MSNSAETKAVMQLTARARGSLFGVEKGSVLYITAEDSMTNAMTTGRIGSGLTHTYGLDRMDYAKSSKAVDFLTTITAEGK